MPSTYTGIDSFTGSLTIPSDGDAASVSSVNPAFEALQNDATYLNNRIGGYRLVNLIHAVVNEAPAEPDAQIVEWQASTTYANPLALLVAGSITPSTNDVLDISFTGYMSAQLNAGQRKGGHVRLTDNQNGGGFVEIPGSKFAWLPDNSDSASPMIWQTPVAIQGYRVVASGGTWALNIEGKVSDTVNVVHFQLVGSYQCVIRQWRQN